MMEQAGNHTGWLQLLRSGLLEQVYRVDSISHSVNLKFVVVVTSADTTLG